MKTSCGFIILNEKTNEILLGLSANSKGDWSIPKGGKEEGENNYSAALRELAEEANISAEFIKGNAVYSLDTQVYQHKKKQLVSFLCICQEKPENIKCTSFFIDSFGNSKPEFTRLEWFNIDSIIDGKVSVHQTQLDAMIQAKKILTHS